METKKYGSKKREFVKPMVALILSFCMVFGMVSFVGSVEVWAAGSPSWNSGAYNGSNPFAVSGYYGQCTWYAWGRACEVTGKQLPCRGNAGTWYNVARNAGWSVGGEPRADSIAVWSGNPGHVAYVESVSGNSVTISESNYWTDYLKTQCWSLDVGKRYYNGTRTLSNSQMQNRSGRLAGYIYLGQPKPQDTTPPKISNVRVTDVNSEGYTVICTVEDAGGVAKVQFPTWTAYNGQDDLAGDWPTSASCRGTQNGTTWSYRVNARDHNNEGGFYATHIYAWDTAGNLSSVAANLICKLYVDKTLPVISNVQVVDMDATGFTVTCRVEDAEGIAKVQFPTWTPLNGRDDLAENCQNNPSCRGTQNGTTWSFRVNDKDHNFERGIYCTHIYAYDKNGNKTWYELNNIVLQNTYSHVNTASYNGHTYYLYNDILTWNEAKAKCEELGGHLATVKSTEEQEAVAALIRGQARKGYWIEGIGVSFVSESKDWNMGGSIGFICEMDGEEAGKPADAENPQTPDNADDAESPQTPDNPGGSGNPDNPAQPDDPDDPDDADDAENPQTPNDQGESGSSDNPEKKPTVSKVKSFKAAAGKKKLTLSWKKLSGIAGYQIQISEKKNFKGAKTISISKSKKTYTKKSLKSKKKYYLRIRAYKTYKDANKKTQKVYGKWTTINKRTK